MSAPPVPLARWMPDDTPPLAAAAVRRALCDVGIEEIPPGSNRSGVIDAYCTAIGAPLGSYWCAAALTAWWRDAGLPTPPRDAASCQAWLVWAKATSRWSPTPSLGAAVIYGDAGARAEHCGLVVRVTPILCSVEGNTSLAGYSRNGVACDFKAVNVDRVLGYVLPTVRNP